MSKKGTDLYFVHYVIMLALIGLRLAIACW